MSIGQLARLQTKAEFKIASNQEIERLLYLMVMSLYLNHSRFDMNWKNRSRALSNPGTKTKNKVQY